MLTSIVAAVFGAKAAEKIATVSFKMIAIGLTALVLVVGVFLGYREVSGLIDTVGQLRSSLAVAEQARDLAISAEKKVRAAADDARKQMERLESARAQTEADLTAARDQARNFTGSMEKEYPSDTRKAPRAKQPVDDAGGAARALRDRGAALNRLLERSSRPAR